MSPARVSPVSFLKLSAEVASFYGFRGVRDMERTLKQARAPRPAGASAFAAAATLAAAAAAERPREPALLFYATPSPTHVPFGAQPREVGEFGLTAVGGEPGSGEILILKTISAIATEWGAPLSRVRLNALGDRESRERHARELFSHLRRRAGELDEACRETSLKDPFRAHACGHEACLAVVQDGPRSVNYLSEKSRVHFRKVLEQVEGLDLPYEIDDLLMGDEREPHIVFAADFAAPDATVVGSFGGRYDEYLRRLAGRREQTAVSASIYFRKKGATRANWPSVAPRRAPKLYFVRLGPLAKLHGLAVLDMLREARLPAAQSFEASALSPQRGPGSNEVSHLIIMGQREALDGTVIVRTLKNGSQTVVELPRLPRFLKTLRA